MKNLINLNTKNFRKNKYSIFLKFEKRNSFLNSFNKLLDLIFKSHQNKIKKEYYMNEKLTNDLSIQNIIIPLFSSIIENNFLF